MLTILVVEGSLAGWAWAWGAGAGAGTRDAAAHPSPSSSTQAAPLASGTRTPSPLVHGLSRKCDGRVFPSLNSNRRIPESQPFINIPTHTPESRPFRPPIGPPTPLDHRRHRGALRVDVLEARGLPKMDTLGSADPSVEVFTVSDQVASTTVKKNTRKPTWNERLWTMVQVWFCVLIGVFRLG